MFYRELKNIVVCSFVLLIMFFSTGAFAISIVNTGTPASENPAWELSHDQWLASQFALTQGYNLTDIYGYMWSNPGNLTMTIYGNTFLSTSFYTYQAPDSNNRYFSKGFSVTQKDTSDWHGLSGLNWYLPAGTYWISFEAQDGDTYSGAMPYPSPNPLYREAWYGSSFGYTRWWPDNSQNIGVRIESNPQVPEPSSLQILVFLALGIGLFPLIVNRSEKAL